MRGGFKNLVITPKIGRRTENKKFKIQNPGYVKMKIHYQNNFPSSSESKIMVKKILKEKITLY
jgi:hypothetical protein